MTITLASRWCATCDAWTDHHAGVHVPDVNSPIDTWPADADYSQADYDLDQRDTQ